MIEPTQPLTVQDVENVLGTTIRHDNQNKVIAFLAKLLTYTEEDQINLGFMAEASTGKSYIALETAWYFPKGDIIILGYASPTAFFHEYGTLMHRQGIPIKFELKPSKETIKEDLEVEKGHVTKAEVEEAYKREMRKWKELLKDSYYLVDLHQKILIFLDMPHDMLLQRLRPLLSHDSKEIVLKITDKREKGGLRTKTVVVRGYPTVVFCSARFSMADQEKTRLLLLSPEISQEKLRESIALRIEKESDREAFYKWMESHPDRVALKKRVELIKSARIKYVKIPEELRSKIILEFEEKHKHLTPRHQRDINRLLGLIKAHALLNFMFRKREGDAIIVNEEDVTAGFQLYYGISEANEMGLAPEIYNIYEKVKPHIPIEGVTILDFQTIYFREFHKPIGSKRAKEILDILTSTGLLVEKPDSNDKRVKRFHLSEVGVNSPPSQGEYILAQEVVERVFKVLCEASRVRGSALLSEIARETGFPEDRVKAVLESLQREGKVYSPYPDFWKVV
ncbi:MAG: hypothetical protein QW660_07965 [Candidatus Bathyarchaeia archaeon]